MLLIKMIKLLLGIVALLIIGAAGVVIFTLGCGINLIVSLFIRRDRDTIKFIVGELLPTINRELHVPGYVGLETSDVFVNMTETPTVEENGTVRGFYYSGRDFDFNRISAVIEICMVNIKVPAILLVVTIAEVLSHEAKHHQQRYTMGRWEMSQQRLLPYKERPFEIEAFKYGNHFSIKNINLILNIYVKLIFRRRGA